MRVFYLVFLVVAAAALIVTSPCHTGWSAYFTAICGHGGLAGEYGNAEEISNPDLLVDVWPSFHGGADRVGNLKKYAGFNTDLAAITTLLSHNPKALNVSDDPPHLNLSYGAVAYTASSPPEGCRVGCSIDTNDTLLSSPVFVDLDGDGADEAVAYHKDMVPPDFDSFGNFVFAFKKRGVFPAYRLDWLWTYPLGEEVHTSFAIMDKRIFFGSDDWNLYALDSEGKLAWNYKTQGKIRSSPSIAKINNKTRIIFGSDDGNLYALDSEGKLAWNYKTQGKIRSSPLLFGTAAKPFIAVGGYDGSIYVLDGGGLLLNRHQTGGPVVASPSAFYRNGSAFGVVGSLDGKLYFFNNSGFFSLPVGGPVYSTSAYINGSEAVILGLSYTGKIFLANETVFKELYVSENASITSSPAIGDSENDGGMDALFSSIYSEGGLNYSRIEIAYPYTRKVSHS